MVQLHGLKANRSLIFVCLFVLSREALTETLSYIMGATAEFLVSKYGFTREQQDEVALRSNNNAEAATENGRFAVRFVIVTIAKTQQSNRRKLCRSKCHNVEASRR